MPETRDKEEGTKETQAWKCEIISQVNAQGVLVIQIKHRMVYLLLHSLQGVPCSFDTDDQASKFGELT